MNNIVESGVEKITISKFEASPITASSIDCSHIKINEIGGFVFVKEDDEHVD